MIKNLLLLFIITGLISSCNSGSNAKKKVKAVSDEISVLGALPLKVPVPDDNPISVEKRELGKLLFFDPILSGNKDVACATCHHPEYGFAESLTTYGLIGVKVWIYKGDILGKKMPQETEAPVRETKAKKEIS